MIGVNHSAMSDETNHIAKISVRTTRVLAALLIATFVSFLVWWFFHAASGGHFDQSVFFKALVVGMIAQLVDGALGMAYGITSNTLLLWLGFSPVAATSTVHVAEAGQHRQAHFQADRHSRDYWRRLRCPACDVN
jgi:uncharacterized protein